MAFKVLGAEAPAKVQGVTQPAKVNGVTGVYPFYPRSIDYSAVFNDDDSDYLSLAYGVPSNTDIGTFSFLLKRGNLGIQNGFYSERTDPNNISQIYWGADDKLNIFDRVGGATHILLTPTQIFRDPTNYFHIAVQFDTSQAVAADRVTLWINGTEVTAFDTATYPAQNADVRMLTQLTHVIGNAQNTAGTNFFYDGYIAEAIYCDGQAYAASDFGESKNGVWVPKTSLSLTYGTNGFYLDFATATLGNDVSGNNNDFTTNGSPAQVTDTPTNNFATINSVRPSPGTLTYGNTVIAGTENGVGTIFVSKGKWAWKVTSAENGNYGIIADDAAATQYVAADVSGEVIEFELDLDGMTLKKRVDGGGLETVQDPIASGKMWAPHFEAAATVDFGANGFTPTDSTYFVLNSANIALYEQNTILDSIDQPGEAIYVQTRLGDAGTPTISDVLFDVSAGALVTIKNRSQADGWKVHSTTGMTGVDYYVAYDANTVETQNANGLTALTSTGYTLGSGAAGWNDNAENFLDWVLREGAAYGLDLVTYEGDGGASQLINHGLGVVPSMIWVKNVDAADSWAVLHSLAASDYETDYAVLDTNVAFADLNTYWNDTAPSSTQFTVGTIDNVNASGETYVAVVLADIPGLCKAFAYTGNGNADGPYIPLGFKAVAYFVKEVPNADQWFFYNSKVSTYNTADDYLAFEVATAEQAASALDFDILAQGIKARSTNGGMNTNATLYVGFAWAEQFGCYSNSR